MSRRMDILEADVLQDRYVKMVKGMDDALEKEAYAAHTALHEELLRLLDKAGSLLRDIRERPDRLSQEFWEATKYYRGLYSWR
jgi:hypothetical protein